MAVLLYTASGLQYPSPTKYEVTVGANLVDEVYHGDLVQYDATDATRIETARATNQGALILGAVAGLFDDTGVPVLFVPTTATTNYIALVWDDPNQLYVTDSHANFDPAADIGATAGYVLGTDSQVTGLSGMELDDKTNAEFRIQDYVRRAGVAATGVAARKVIVKFNEHLFL